MGQLLVHVLELLSDHHPIVDLNVPFHKSVLVIKHAPAINASQFVPVRVDSMQSVVESTILQIVIATQVIQEMLCMDAMKLFQKLNKSLKTHATPVRAELMLNVKIEMMQLHVFAFHFILEILMLNVVSIIDHIYTLCCVET